MRTKNDLIKMLIMSSILILTSNALLSQNSTPDNMGLKQFTIEDKKLGTIDFYVNKENLHKKLPVILDVQGSGGFPFIINFQHPDDTLEICLINKYLLEQSKDKYHYVIISKPGIPFSSNIVTKSRNYMQLLEDYQPTEEYTRRLDLEWRTMASSKVIDYLCKNIEVDKSKIAVWGYSEGGNVVPEIARVNNKVTHVVSIGGAGLNHFYDDIINNRLKAERGEISHLEAQKNIDSLFIVFDDIYKNPESTKYWRSNS